jgi:hypothetical protein
VSDPDPYARLGDAAWRWVLDQVKWDDGPWIPVSVPHDGGSARGPRRDAQRHRRPAHVLAEVTLARPWTDEESAIADGTAARVRAGLGTTTAYS